MNVIVLKKELSEIQHDKESLTKENEKMEECIYFLKNDEKFIEHIAREELGLVRSGEMIYFFKSK